MYEAGKDDAGVVHEVYVITFAAGHPHEHQRVEAWCAPWLRLRGVDGEPITCLVCAVTPLWELIKCLP